MNDELRERIKQALFENIEPPTTGLGDRIAVGLAAAPQVPGLVAFLQKVANLLRHWLTIVGAGTIAVIAVAVVLVSRPPDISLYVAYADSGHPTTGQSAPVLPGPWAGSAGVTFKGTGPPFDAGALRIDNNTGGEITVDHVSVSIGTSHLELWGTGLKVRANGTLILTQTKILVTSPIQTNFDTSEAKGETCVVSPQVAVIDLTVNGHHLQFRDQHEVLTTAGRDLGTCPGSPNESHQWERLPPA